MTAELAPFVLYCLRGSELECALWQLAEGQKAIALFSTEEGAISYRQTANLGPEWNTLRPPRDALLQLVRACASMGVGLAVLDPDSQKAKRMFNLHEILLAIESLPS